MLGIPYSRLFSKQIFAQAVKFEFSKILISKKLYFKAQVDFELQRNPCCKLWCLCLPRTYLLIGMAYDGILTKVEAGSHLSVATLHLSVVTLMKKKALRWTRQHLCQLSKPIKEYCQLEKKIRNYTYSVVISDYIIVAI